jgi:hypothetical protein
LVDDPFVTLIVEALNLMHPRFAAGGPDSFRYELYHQLRHLWDRAVPVQLGLGHVLIQADEDLHFQQLGERGVADAKLGVVAVANLADTEALDAALDRLSRFRKTQGYPNAVCAIAGHLDEIPSSGLPEVPGIVTVLFDVVKWRVA